MADDAPRTAPSRGSLLPRWAKIAVLGTGLVLLLLALGLSWFGTSCTTETSTETVTSTPASPTAAKPTPAKPVVGAAGSTSELSSTTRTTTQTCAPPGPTSSGVLILLILAGLTVTPWVSRVELFGAAADLIPATAEAVVRNLGVASSARVDEVRQPHSRGAPPGVANGPAAGDDIANKESLTRLFVGTPVPVPDSWSDASYLLYLRTRRDDEGTALQLFSAAPGDPFTEAPQLYADVMAALEGPTASAETAGVLRVQSPQGATMLLASAANGAGRVLAHVVVLVPQATVWDQASDADIAKLARPLVLRAQAWSRVIVDVLELDDDS